MILQFQMLSEYDLLVVCALNEQMNTVLRNGLMKNYPGAVNITKVEDERPPLPDDSVKEVLIYNNSSKEKKYEGKVRFNKNGILKDQKGEEE